MAVSNKFSDGKYALGICDVCGVRAAYLDLKEMTVMGRRTGSKACPSCWDPDHPQNFLPYAVRVDAQALRDPRPDTGLEASRRLTGHWSPPLSLVERG